MSDDELRAALIEAIKQTNNLILGWQSLHQKLPEGNIVQALVGDAVTQFENGAAILSMWQVRQFLAAHE